MNHLLTEDAHAPRPVSRARTNISYRLRVSNEGRTFAQVLREVLDRDFGGSNADFARAAGINVGQVGRYLNGQKPRPETLVKMAPLMGMSRHRLQDLVDAQPGDPDAAPRDIHPYATQLNQLLTPGLSDISDANRANLEQVINTVLTPYRKDLRGRKAV